MPRLRFYLMRSHPSMMMNWNSASSAGLALILSAVAARAQERPRQVRLTTADSVGERRWTGYVQRLTRDSIELRVSPTGPDTIVTFSRTAIHLAERRTAGVSKQRAAIVGCAIGAAALGAAGFAGPDKSGDYSGMKKINGVSGIVLGCPAGAIVGVLVSRGQKWESWRLPD